MAKVAKSAKSEMKKSLTLWLYVTSNDCYGKRVHVFAKKPTGAAQFNVKIENGKAVLTSEGGAINASTQAKEYCDTFTKLLGTGPLPVGKLIKWTITAELDSLDVTSQKAALEAALNALK